MLRRGKFAELDIENIASEIEEVGKNEHRGLASRLTVLLGHLLKWRYQPSHRSQSWIRTIDDQRRVIARKLKKMPGLKPLLSDAEWLDEVWVDAVKLAADETGIVEFPHACPWPIDEVLDPGFLPT